MIPLSTGILILDESATASANLTFTDDSEEMIPLVKAEIMGLNSGVSNISDPARLHEKRAALIRRIITENWRSLYMSYDLGN